MRVFLAVLCALALAAPAGAVTLVNVEGAPVGGKFQRWAEEAKAPESPAVVGFTTSLFTIYSLCPPVEALGCTQWPQHVNGSYTEPVIAILDDQFAHSSLMHELGHVFDATVLTNADRGRFARIWHLNPNRVVKHWFTLPRGPNGPYDEWFAEGWDLCAQYGSDGLTLRRALNAPIGFGYPAVYGSPYSWPINNQGDYTDSARVMRRGERLALRRQRQVCALIATAARSASAPER